MKIKHPNSHPLQGLPKSWMCSSALLQGKIALKNTSLKCSISITYVDTTNNQAQVLFKDSIFECYVPASPRIFEHLKRNDCPKRVT